MNERLKQLRKATGLSQGEFGKKIGVGKTSISKLESGENNPSEQTILLICSSFDVNEIWLRTGDGEMFVQKTRNQQITDFLTDLIKEDDGAFKKRLIEAMSKLDKRDWEDIERLVDKLIKKD